MCKYFYVVLLMIGFSQVALSDPNPQWLKRGFPRGTGGTVRSAPPSPTLPHLTPTLPRLNLPARPDPRQKPPSQRFQPLPEVRPRSVSPSQKVSEPTSVGHQPALRPVPPVLRSAPHAPVVPAPVPTVIPAPVPTTIPAPVSPLTQNKPAVLSHQSHPLTPPVAPSLASPVVHPLVPPPVAHPSMSSATQPPELHAMNVNKISQIQQERVAAATDRASRVMVTSAAVNAVVVPHVETFVTVYRPVIVEQYNIYAGYYSNWSALWIGSPWVSWGFFGGFSYPLLPVYDIHVYFWNPLVLWLYLPVWEETYYRTWYATSLDTCPNLRTRFSVPGVFYPTTELTHLALGVSGMPEVEQGNFMLSMNDLVGRLQTKLSQRMNIPAVLHRNEIVMNHYEMFESDKGSGVVLEGYVSTSRVQFPFKTVFDLRSNDPTLSNRLFVPHTGDGEPTDAEIAQLQELNNRIIELGGSISTEPPPVSSSTDPQ